MSKRMTGEADPQATGQRSAPGAFRAIIAALLAVDLLLHALTLALGPAPLLLDSAGYWSTGGQVVEGDWLQMGVDAPYRTPAYTYFVAFNRACFGHYALLSVVLLQHVATWMTTLITAFTCMWLYRNRWGFVLGYGLNLLFLTRLWDANFLLTEALFTLFFTAGMAAVLLYHQSQQASRAAAAGLLLGLATLVRPVPQLLVPALSFTLLLAVATHRCGAGLRRRRNRRPQFSRVVPRYHVGPPTPR